MTPPLTHIAGLVVHVDRLLRQRCAWCGATLIDEDTSLVQVLEADRHRPLPTWEPGAFVAVDGGASWVVEAEQPDGTVSAHSCARLDPEVTR